MLFILILITSFLRVRQQDAGTVVYASDGMGVFWDKNCTRNVQLIEWGALLPGSTKIVILYVYNGLDQPVFLYMETENWVPLQAEDCIGLQLRCDRRSIRSYEVFQVSLILETDEYVHNVTAFDFDLIFNGFSHPLGDLNEDKKVDMRDLAIVCKAYGSHPGHPGWNPIADVNQDGKVDMVDVSTVAKEYGLQ